MSRWINLQHVLTRLSERMNDKRLGVEERKFLQDLYKRLLWHEVDVQDVIAELELTALRNPMFHGDLMGWFDDDSEDDDEEEDEDLE